MERTLLQLTENIPVGTYVLETDAQQQPRFTFLSDRWLQMLDVRREEVMADPGKGFSCVHPDDFEAFMALNRKVFAQIETFTGKAGSWCAARFAGCAWSRCRAV